MRIVKHFPAQWPNALTWTWIYLNTKVSASRAFTEILCGCSVRHTSTSLYCYHMSQCCLNIRLPWTILSCNRAKAMGYTAAIRFLAETRDVSLLYNVQTGSGVHPAPYPMSIGRSLKRPGREADQSPPSSAEAKNGGAIPPHPPHVFMV
jgi:hypothetical protein